MDNTGERFIRKDPDLIECQSKDGKTEITLKIKDELMETLEEDERKMLELTTLSFAYIMAGLVDNKRDFESGGLSIKDALAIVVIKLMEANEFFLGKGD